MIPAQSADMTRYADLLRKERLTKKDIIEFNALEDRISNAQRIRLEKSNPSEYLKWERCICIVTFSVKQADLRNAVTEALHDAEIPWRLMKINPLRSNATVPEMLLVNNQDIIQALAIYDNVKGTQNGK